MFTKIRRNKNNKRYNKNRMSNLPIVPSTYFNLKQTGPADLPSEKVATSVQDTANTTKHFFEVVNGNVHASSQESTVLKGGKPKKINKPNILNKRVHKNKNSLYHKGMLYKTKRYRSFLKRKNLLRGGGRTIDNINPVGAQTPGYTNVPSYNNALYMGEPCVGPHCGTPINPNANTYLDSLRGGEGIIADGLQQVSFPRLGNNTDLGSFPGVQAFDPSYNNVQCSTPTQSGGRRRRHRNKKSKKTHKKSKRNH
jgi:hypothetical protein